MGFTVKILIQSVQTRLKGWEDKIIFAGDVHKKDWASFLGNDCSFM